MKWTPLVLLLMVGCASPAWAQSNYTYTDTIGTTADKAWLGAAAMFLTGAILDAETTLQGHRLAITERNRYWRASLQDSEGRFIRCFGGYALTVLTLSALTAKRYPRTTRIILIALGSAHLLSAGYNLYIIKHF